MVLTFCTRHVLFIIVTCFSLAVGHLNSINYQARLNKNWQAFKIQLETKADELCSEKFTEFAEYTGTSKSYRDTYLRTPKSGYTGLPVISRTPKG